MRDSLIAHIVSRAIFINSHELSTLDIENESKSKKQPRPNQALTVLRRELLMGTKLA